MKSKIITLVLIAATVYGMCLLENNRYMDKCDCTIVEKYTGADGGRHGTSIKFILVCKGLDKNEMFDLYVLPATYAMAQQGKNIKFEHLDRFAAFGQDRYVHGGVALSVV